MDAGMETALNCGLSGQFKLVLMGLFLMEQDLSEKQKL
jgi:hypothetical protein